MSNGRTKGLIEGISPYIKSTADLITQFLLQDKKEDKYPYSAEAYKQLTEMMQKGEFFETKPDIYIPLMQKLSPTDYPRFTDIEKRLRPPVQKEEDAFKLASRQTLQKLLQNPPPQEGTPEYQEYVLDVSNLTTSDRSSLFSSQAKLWGGAEDESSQLLQTMIKGKIKPTDPNFPTLYNQLSKEDKTQYRNFWGLIKPSSEEGAYYKIEDIEKFDIGGKPYYRVKYSDGSYSTPRVIGSGDLWLKTLLGLTETLDNQLLYLRSQTPDERDPEDIKAVEENKSYTKEQIWAKIPNSEAMRNLYEETVKNTLRSFKKPTGMLVPRMKEKGVELELSTLTSDILDNLTPEEYTQLIFNLTEEVANYYVELGFGKDDAIASDVLKGLAKIIEYDTGTEGEAGINILNNTEIWEEVLKRLDEREK